MQPSIWTHDKTLEQLCGSRGYDKPINVTAETSISQLQDFNFEGLQSRNSEKIPHQQQGISSFRSSTSPSCLAASSSPAITQNHLAIGNQQDIMQPFMFNVNNNVGASFHSHHTEGNQEDAHFDQTMLHNNLNMYPLSRANLNTCNTSAGGGSVSGGNFEPLNILGSAPFENRRRSSLAMLSSMMEDIGPTVPSSNQGSTYLSKKASFRRSSIALWQSMVADGDLDFDDQDHYHQKHDQENQSQQSSLSPVKTFRRASMAFLNSVIADGDLEMLTHQDDSATNPTCKSSLSNGNMNNGAFRRGSLFLVDKLLQDMEGKSSPPPSTATVTPTLSLSPNSNNRSQVEAGVPAVTATTTMNNKYVMNYMNRTYDDNLKSLQDAALLTKQSAQEIIDWDIRMGLKKSHSKLMIKTARSRKRVLASLIRQMKKNARKQLKSSSAIKRTLKSKGGATPKRKSTPKKKTERLSNDKS